MSAIIWFYNILSTTFVDLAVSTVTCVQGNNQFSQLYAVYLGLGSLNMLRFVRLDLHGMILSRASVAYDRILSC